MALLLLPLLLLHVNEYRNPTADIKDLNHSGMVAMLRST